MKTSLLCLLILFSNILFAKSLKYNTTENANTINLIIDEKMDKFDIYISYIDILSKRTDKTLYIDADFVKHNAKINKLIKLAGHNEIQLIIINADSINRELYVADPNFKSTQTQKTMTFLQESEYIFQRYLHLGKLTFVDKLDNIDSTESMLVQNK